MMPPAPYYQDDYVTLYCGDCREIVPTLDPVDAIVTDPPYGLRFMGKSWDYDVPTVDLWRLCLQVAKPGAHLLSFAGTRTQHRMAVNIEDAGFEIRDMIAWVYGSGFPKSQNVSKAIDKAAGAERKKVPNPHAKKQTASVDTTDYGDYQAVTHIEPDPATDAAQQWDGWGTALKPALEPITMARVPFRQTVAANVLEHGTGAINVDGGRVGYENGEVDFSKRQKQQADCGEKGWKGNVAKVGSDIQMFKEKGRFPANLIHDGSDEVVRLFPVTTSKGHAPAKGKGNPFGGANDTDREEKHFDTGSAARFFYCAKASKRDRDEGLEGLPEASAGARSGGRKEGSAGLVMNGGKANPYAGTSTPARNTHPTIKPTDLMRYLVRLVTPPGGVVLDPFMGSGSTGKAAVLEGFRFIGIERDEESCEIAVARIKHAIAQAKQPRQEVLPLGL